MRWVVLRLMVTPEEKRQIQLAATLKGMTITEFIKHACNERLRKDGVDAVLFPEKGEK